MAQEKYVTELVEWLLKEPKTSLSLEKLQIQHTEYGGRGLVASSKIAARSPILTVPHSHLMNYSTVLAHITSWSDTPAKHSFKVPEPVEKDDTTALYAELTHDSLHKLTSSQIVPMYICLEKQRGARSWWKPFLDSLPPFTDFTMSPMVWLVEDDPLFTTLPTTTQSHAHKMLERFTKDFAAVAQLTKQITKDQFLWAWFCVNSRCLYMSIPGAHSKEDNFTLCPYVDFINHSSDDHCSLKIDQINGFQVWTTKGYEEGEQVFLSYGPHSNEFLLCEYGFALPENPWNDVDLTEVIEGLLNAEEKLFLEEKGYGGEYTISMDSVSFRVEVALAVMLEKDGRLADNRRLAALLSGVSDGKFYKRKSDLMLMEILEGLEKSLKEKMVDGEDEKSKVVNKLYKDQLSIIKHHLEVLQETYS